MATFGAAVVDDENVVGVTTAVVAEEEDVAEVVLMGDVAMVVLGAECEGVMIGDVGMGTRMAVVPEKKVANDVTTAATTSSSTSPSAPSALAEAAAVSQREGVKDPEDKQDGADAECT